MEKKNYIKLKNRIPFRSTYCFIDTTDYIGDEIFYNHELYQIRFFKTELHKRGSDFTVVRCSIFNKDISKFEECMEHLRRKLEFLDYDMEEYDMISALFGLIEEKMGEVSYE